MIKKTCQFKADAKSGQLSLLLFVFILVLMLFTLVAFLGRIYKSPLVVEALVIDRPVKGAQWRFDGRGPDRNQYIRGRRLLESVSG